MGKIIKEVANKYLATLNDWLSRGDKEAIQRPCFSKLEADKNDLTADLDQLGRKV